MTNNTLPEFGQCFDLTFENGHIGRAIRVPLENDAQATLKALGMDTANAVIFISGGAAYMTPEDLTRVQNIIDGVAQFAQEKGAVIIDGGTEAGIMQIVGEARNKGDYTFPLIGVSPMGKVSFPGYKNPNEEAYLEDSHSHFVLVEGDKWGDETKTIIEMTRAICHQGKAPSAGILVNGGKIAMHEMYLAATAGGKLPIIVLEGSGRTADEISTAFRSGQTQRGILRAILSGADIQLVAVNEGPVAVREKLEEKFR